MGSTSIWKDETKQEAVSKRLNMLLVETQRSLPFFLNTILLLKIFLQSCFTWILDDKVVVLTPFFFKVPFALHLSHKPEYNA